MGVQSDGIGTQGESSRCYRRKRRNWLAITMVFLQEGATVVGARRHPEELQKLAEADAVTPVARESRCDTTHGPTEARRHH